MHSKTLHNNNDKLFKYGASHKDVQRTFHERQSKRNIDKRK
uniref:Uncharacterized protein n=1 Tax=Anguilla anguilla TaxID=7936 RepID=A0A0E9RF60_ANGAN